MGGAASPRLATLYCSYRELLHTQATRIALVGVRYIDDVLVARSANEPSVLQRIDYGLQFGSVETGLTKANFVGITITNSSPPFFCIYDRRLEFDCDVIRLPHTASALSAHVAPATICGKLCRAWSLSSSRTAFAEEACLTSLQAAARNYTLSSIRKGWGLFLRRLQADFVSNERLEVVKNCCLAITELSADRRALLVQIATRARDRQGACLSPTTSTTQQLDSLDSTEISSLKVDDNDLREIATRARDRQRARLSPTMSTTQLLDSLDSIEISSLSVDDNYFPRRTVAASSTTTTTSTTTVNSAVLIVVRHGIANVGNTCYIAVSFQIIATLKARSSNAVNLRAVSAVMDTRRG